MKRYLLLTLILPFLYSCEKELDFKYHDVESPLVIEGNLTEKGASVLLTFTTPMNEAMDTTPVNDAVVMLKDLTTDISYNLLPNSKGVYCDNTPGIPGHEYELSVNRGEEQYTSACMMRPAVKDLELKFQWIKMPYDHVAILEVSFSDPVTEEDYFWIRLYRNGEPYKWLLSDDSKASGGKINEITFTTRMDLDEEDDKDILRDGDVVKAMVVGVSREMYDYLVGIQADSNGPRMFTGDFCLGYFLAAEVTEGSIVFHPDEIPYYP